MAAMTACRNGRPIPIYRIGGLFRPRASGSVRADRASFGNTIMADNAYDLVVIGTGPGGYVAAIRAAQLGMRTAVVEKRATHGGTCLNVGCIPSKALLDSSELYAQARTHFAAHGVKVGDVGLDLPTMHARKDRVVKGLTEGVLALLKRNKIDTYNGTARLASAGQVVVKGGGGDEVTLAARAVILATGSEAVGLPPLPFDGKHIVSSTEALAFDRVPHHLIVVGAGYIGLELGSVWQRLGSKVTVVEFLPRILPQTDAEIADLAHRSLTKQGLVFALDTRVTGASSQGGQVIVNAAHKGQDV